MHQGFFKPNTCSHIQTVQHKQFSMCVCNIQRHLCYFLPRIYYQQNVKFHFFFKTSTKTGWNSTGNNFFRVLVPHSHLISFLPLSCCFFPSLSHHKSLGRLFTSLLIANIPIAICNKCINLNQFLKLKLSEDTVTREQQWKIWVVLQKRFPRSPRPFKYLLCKHKQTDLYTCLI